MKVGHVKVPLEKFPLAGVPSAILAPKDVRLDAVTELFSVAPVSVPAAAVTVIGADPSKFVPLIARGVVRVAAEPVVDWLNVGHVNVPLEKFPLVGVPRRGVMKDGLLPKDVRLDDTTLLASVVPVSDPAMFSAPM